MFNKNTHMVQLPVPGEVISGGEFLIQQGLGVSGHYFGCTAALPGTVVGQNSFPTAGSGSCPFLPPLRRRAAKTDRHSKIYTSQGPRDRRVRLSIGIARRFFDLQEMLGFDKPSKTLDWLLTKSKSAIKDLVQSAAADQTPAEKSELEQKSKGKSAAETSDQTAAATTTKESRAKARDRARARTREKKMMMSNQIVNSSSERNPIFPIQYMNNNQIVHEVCTISSGNSSWPHLHGQIRKSKNPPIWGFHQNLLSSRDLGSMANENWDHTTSFASSQPLYAILDQPKCFINSTNSNG